MTDPVPNLDYAQFAEDLDALRARLEADAGPADVRHLQGVIWWSRLAAILGYGTAWIAPNPLSALLISLHSTARWTIVAHHVSHRGLDRIEGVPASLTSKTFAKGSRRLWDWFEWFDPAAWDFEHNRLHHYRLGELADPDLPEEQLSRIRESQAPLFAKYVAIFGFMLTWKFVYYAANTFAILQRENRRKAEKRPVDLQASSLDIRLADVWNPLRAEGRAFWARCILPYGLLRFLLLPALFLPLGWWAVLSVFLNSVLAEALTNVHSFWVIVPNHAGDDVHRFDRPSTDRAEFYVRQVLGSVNMRTGGGLNDYLHGYLNYQIEHHLWPDLSPLQYQKAAPEVRAICAKHGVPYVQEPVGRRMRQLMRILTGQASMLQSRTRSKQERSAPADRPAMSG